MCTTPMITVMLAALDIVINYWDTVITLKIYCHMEFLTLLNLIKYQHTFIYSYSLAYKDLHVCDILLTEHGTGSSSGEVHDSP